MMNNIANFREEADIVNEFLINKTKKLVQKKGAYFYIDKKLLMKEKHCRSILNFALDPFGFNGSQIDDLIKNISTNGLVGKVLNSAAYTLTIDRETLILRENKAGDKEDITFKTLDALKKSGVFKVKKLKQFMVPGSKELILNVDSLIFPLTVRGKATGDRFRPFGMKGFKLLSDFFKEQKLNNFEKENCKVLVNGNGEIIWVIGYRSDDRYQVNTKSTQLIKLFFVEQ